MCRAFTDQDLLYLLGVGNDRLREIEVVATFGYIEYDHHYQSARSMNMLYIYIYSDYLWLVLQQ